VTDPGTPPTPLTAPSATPAAASGFQRLLRSDAPWMLARLAALAGLAAVAALLWGGWGIDTVAVPDPLMYTNLGNLAFWVFFMMGLPFLALFAGRAFCAVCPLGALNEWAGRHGLGRAFPGALRNDAGKVALLLLTMGLLGIARIHHWPGATFWYLAGWVLLALLLGALFRGRSLCSFACPLGGMLGLYSRAASPAVGVADPEVCRSCTGRECVRGRESWTTAALGRLAGAFRFRRAGCPVHLRPWEIEGSGRCLLCGNCLRACPWGNAVLRARPPLSSLWRESFPRFSETATAAALLGFLLLSFARFWPALAAVLAAPGQFLSPLIGVGLSRALFIVWGGLLLPFLLLAAPALVTRWRLSSSGPGAAPPGEGRGGVRLWWRRPSAPVVRRDEDEEGAVERADSLRGLMATFLPAFIPVLLGGHLLLAAVKLNAKAAYLPLAVADPGGVRSYMAVEELSLVPRPGLLFPLAPLKWALLVVFALCVALSLWVALRIGRRERLPAGAAAAAVMAVAACVAGGFLKWLF
jgi:polyferredoxin